MKLTKKLESEILKVYNGYWEAALKGDMKTFASMMDEEISIFGSAVSEVFSNKKEAVRFYKETADQMTDRAQFRNRRISMQPAGNSIVLREQSDWYLLAGNKWTFYGRARITAVLQYDSSGWKLVHLHASLPDARAGKGEQVAAEKIKKENLRLREAVQRRTIELEQKNRELEIEAALERVRTAAMGMKQPADMLEICRTISQELEALEVKDIRNVQTAIFYPQRGTYMNYEYYARHKKTFITETTYTNNKIHKSFAMKMLKGEGEFFTTHIKGKKVKEWIAYQKTTNVFIDKYLKTAASLSYYWYSLGPVAMGISSYVPLSDEHLNLFKRFRNVFELAYRRYLDIEKAEAQAREAQIETALERIRARAMAMHSSDELMDVANILREQMGALGQPELETSVVHVYEEGSDRILAFHAFRPPGQSSGKIMTGTLSFSNHSTVVTREMMSLYRSGTKEFTLDIAGAKLREFVRVLIAAEPVLANYMGPGKNHAKTMYNHFVAFEGGALLTVSYRPPTEEIKSLQRRAATVFEMGYRRYLDLKKAESQARESQIQLALERVRARTMAMQNSEELTDTSSLLFEQFEGLGVVAEQISIAIVNEDRQTVEIYATVQGKKFESSYEVKISEQPAIRATYDAFKSGRKSALLHLKGNELRDYNVWRNKVRGTAHYPVEIGEADHWYIHLAFFSKGLLSFSTHDPAPDEAMALLERFAETFNLTFARFLDLQKAEAQAREAQIEAALERVRSRSMGMQKSEELKEVIQVVYQQFVHLRINVDHAGFIVDYTPKGDWHFWIADQREIPSKITHPYFDSVWAHQFNEAKEKGIGFFATNLSFEEKNKFYKDLFKFIPGVPKESLDFYFNIPGLAASTVLLDNVGLYIENFSGTPYKDEENTTLMRFGRVFQQTYTRFLDLQKAEAQARDAQIEAALERVRSKAMAMHNSGDLSATVSAVFSELRKLGVETIRTGVALYSKEQTAPVYYASTTSEDDSDIRVTGSPDPSRHPCLALQHEAWLKQQNYFPVLKGEELRRYYEVISIQQSTHSKHIDPVQHEENGCYMPFSEGNLYAWSLKPYTPEEINILSRFRAIVDLTFRRYFDLQKAEEQAREAQIEAALERVRSRTMAMQKSEELSETSYVLFQQLRELGEVAKQLSIGVFNEEEGILELYATIYGNQWKESGRLPFNKSAVHRTTYAAWKEGKKSLVLDLSGDELDDFNRFKMEHSAQYRSEDEIPRDRWVIHSAFFSKGMLSFSSHEPRPPETVQLLERFASVFDLTLTRFNDLKLAEAQARQAQLDLIQLQTEKKRAEDALAELNATQAQLVQQEKLASLGQLTAGIAHEIKNPLNFVSNFSSVSVELVDEAMSEIRKLSGSSGDVQQLLDDVKKNLGKIIEHGSRADGIVKSMLQHSRGGTGKREPTDLNALVKEFVNLGFHGMRASKNPFNVDIEFSLDPSLGRVQLVGEDFSRVVLNLCQNAFDAMREKLNSSDKSYRPKLSIRTRSEPDRVVLEIEDNGPGIPDEIRDKILQPFFTTKKGTQGTGLGLSITNDIVKAHGGELRVETNEGKGSEFIITLPT